MKFATLRNGRPDGQLVVVSSDLMRYVSAGRIAPNLQAALDDWEALTPALAALGAELDAGAIAGQPFDPALAMAPLPRAYQWIDGAGYLGHLERVRSLQGSKDAELQSTRPLLYQGGSDTLSGATDPIIIPEDGLALDYEAEVAVISARCRCAPPANRPPPPFASLPSATTYRCAAWSPTICRTASAFSTPSPPHPLRPWSSRPMR